VTGQHFLLRSGGIRVEGPRQGWKKSALWWRNHIHPTVVRSILWRGYAGQPTISSWD